MKPQTFYVKNVLIQNHILPFFTQRRINEINIRTINAFREKLIGHGYKATYLRTIHAQLSSIFNYAVKYYNLSSNPSEAVGSFSESANSTKVPFWTVDEFRKFTMTSLRLPQHIMAFYLLFWTGMRVGEMLALTWNDIDFTTRCISIHKTLYHLNSKDYINTTKTASSNRTIVMPRFISAMLKDYKRMSIYTSETKLFPITRDALLKKLHEGAKKAGVKGIRLHDLRHSHASMLIANHCTPVEVADRLGHKDPSITLKIYSHMYAAQRQGIADMLDCTFE